MPVRVRVRALSLAASARNMCFILGALREESEQVYVLHLTHIQLLAAQLEASNTAGARSLLLRP